MANFDPKRFADGVINFVPVTLSQGGEELGTVQLPREAVEGKSEKEVIDVAFRAFQRLKAAEEGLDRKQIREMAKDLDIHDVLCLRSAWMVASNAVNIYIERAQEDEKEGPIAEKAFPADDEGLQKWIESLVDRIKKDLLGLFTENPSEAEKVYDHVWKHVIAWAAEDMEKDLGTKTVQAMPGDEFDAKLNEYIFEKQDFGRVADMLMDYYAQDLARLYLEALDPEGLPLKKLRRFLGFVARKDKDGLLLIDLQMFDAGAETAEKADPVVTPPSDLIEQTFAVPLNPIMQATTRALYAKPDQWKPDDYERPQYHYESRDGHITLYFEHPPGGMEAVGALWKAVNTLSVETADVFLILMAKIAQLADPKRDMTSIRLKEIAEYRAVKKRDGSTRTLYEDFKQQVLRLSDLRLTMVWEDYRKGGKITFGKDRPDRLFDIVDVEYESPNGETWTAFSFRCGQALAHFLNKDELRWIGYYSRPLLQLNPYHDAFTKKLGTYLLQIAPIAHKKGSMATATPATILDFAGTSPDQRNPGRTIDSFIEAYNRLHEIGVIKQIPDLEPQNRHRGYFRKWLNTPHSVQLSEAVESV